MREGVVWCGVVWRGDERGEGRGEGRGDECGGAKGHAALDWARGPGGVERGEWGG